MLYQLSYASPTHPETSRDAPTTMSQFGVDTLPLHALCGTEIKVSTRPPVEQTGLRIPSAR
jgi:hypothetical protein